MSGRGGTGGIITVRMVVPFLSYKESPVLGKLDDIMEKNAVDFKYHFYENAERTSYNFDEQGILDFNVDDDMGKYLHSTDNYMVSFMDLKDSMVLVRESCISQAPVVNKGNCRDLYYDRYYLFENGNLVTKYDTFKKALKDNLKITIPSQKIKQTPIMGNFLQTAKFLTELEEKINHK
jgi:hypothetical protein